MLLSNEEALVNAREALREIEEGGPKQGVRKGKFATSRPRQYFDATFPPAPPSLGYIARAKDVDPTLWKTSVFHSCLPPTTSRVATASPDWTGLLRVSSCAYVLLLLPFTFCS